MKIVVNITEEYYNLLKAFDGKKCSIDMLLLKNGTPLPDGAEILTKEAYSDLCARAADVSDFESNE